MIVRELITLFGFKADDAALARVDASIASVRKTALAAAGAVAALSVGAIGLTRSFANAGDQARKNAQAIGLSTEEYQELDFAAQLAGSSIEAMSPGVRALSRAMDGANRRGGAQAELFQRIGVNVTDAEGRLRRSADVMGDVADVFARMEDGAEKTALAQELFSRSGAQMIPLLNQGGDAMRAAREEARAFGAVISDEAARQGERFNDTLFRLRTAALGVRNEIGQRLLPVLSDAADGVLDWVRQNQALIRQRVSRWTDEAVSRAREWIATARRVVETVRTWIDRMGGLEAMFARLRIVIVAFLAFKLASVFVAVAGAVLGAVRAVRALGVAAALANAKVMLIPLAFAAIATAAWLVWDDLRAFFAGHESLIGAFVERWRDAGGVLGWFAGMLLDARDHGATALSLMANDVRAWGRIAGAVFDGVLGRLRGIFEASVGLFAAAGQAATGRFGLAAETARMAREAASGGAAGVPISERVESIRSEQSRIEETIMQTAGEQIAERRASRDAANPPPINVNLDVDIDVDGAGDPEQTAREVMRQVEASMGDALDRVFSQTMRNFAPEG